MSLYNMLFGRNGQSDLLLAVIGLKQVDIERFRDCHVEDEGKAISVYARTGGGNRADYPQVTLYSNPLFVRTEDDDFDSTYATFYFRVPEEFVSDVAGLSDPLTYGLRPEFAHHIAATLRRAPTDEDKQRAAYDAERERLRRTSHQMANGHTFVPLTDSAMQTALELAEANNGELLSAWGILPLRVPVVIDKKRELRIPKTGETYIDWSRAEIGYEWVIDEAYWAHCQQRFSDTFPAAMRKITTEVHSYLDRAKAKGTAS